MNSKLSPEESMFYSDFLDSQVLSSNELDLLVRSARINQDINPNGAILDIVEDDISLARIQINTRLRPAKATVRFAGCKIDVDLARLKSDIDLTEQSQTGPF